MTRACGPCDACCILLGVRELGKRRDVRCEHLRDDGAGCAIYERRPKSCRAFACFWLLGHAGGRPSDCGYISYGSEDDRGRMVLCLREFRPGAFCHAGHVLSLMLRRNAGYAYTEVQDASGRVVRMGSTPEFVADCGYLPAVRPRPDAAAVRVELILASGGLGSVCLRPGRPTVIGAREWQALKTWPKGRPFSLDALCGGGFF